MHSMQFIFIVNFYFRPILQLALYLEHGTCFKVCSYIVCNLFLLSFFKLILQLALYLERKTCFKVYKYIVYNLCSLSISIL